MLKKRLIYIILALMLTACIVTVYADADAKGTNEHSERPIYAGSFEGGTKYDLGNFKIAVLEGTYKEMGKQYGYLLKNEINQYYSEQLNTQVFSSDNFSETAEQYYNRYPARIKAIFEGIAETSGLELDQLKLIDSTLSIRQMEGENSESSAFAAWGGYTGGEPLIFGRNYGYSGVSEDSGETVVIVIYKPTDGSRAVMTFGNAGQVSSVQAFNDESMVIGVDAADKTCVTGLQDQRVCVMDTTTDMFDYDNLMALESEIKSTTQTLPVIFTVTDGNEAVSYELNINECQKRSNADDGFVAVTNHFTDPLWDGDVSQSDSDSVKRYNNLVNWGKENKGAITPEKAKDVLETPVSSGGVLTDDTATQFVCTPATGEVWVQVPGYQDWVKIPMQQMMLR